MNATRRLTAADETQFIKLLRSIYHETYSYKFLYETGSFASLVNNEQLISYGEFDGNDQLLAHTGFWRKENQSDYIESGCSFRLSFGSTNFKKQHHPAIWEAYLQEFSRNYAFVHQQCSTLHSLAQRYAIQYMRAKPCGFILNYTQDEHVKGIRKQAKNMHALMMTTTLSNKASYKKTVYLPKPFHHWLRFIYENLNLPRSLIDVTSFALLDKNIYFETIENNPFINMTRRRATLSESPITTALRTDLIHLPIEAPENVTGILPALLHLGYLPCGLRPHNNQPDELILQNISGNRDTLTTLMSEMKIASSETKHWLEQWQSIALQIL